MGNNTKRKNKNSNNGDTIPSSSAIVSTNNNSTTTTTTMTATTTTTTAAISSNLNRVILISILLAQLLQQQGIMAFRVNISARHQHVFKAHLFREHASIQLRGQISAGESAFLLQQAAAIGANRTQPNDTLLPMTPGGMIDGDVGGDGGGGGADGESVTWTKTYNDNSEVPKGLNVVDEIHTLLNLPNKMKVPVAVAAIPEGQEQYQVNQQELEMDREREGSDDDDDEPEDFKQEFEDFKQEYEDYNYEENNNQIYIFDNNKINNYYYGYKIPSVLIIFVVSMNVTMTILYLGIFAMALFLSSQKRRTQKINLTDIYTDV